MPKKGFFFLEQRLSGRFLHVACKPRLPLAGSIAALGLGLTLGQVFSLLVLKPSRIAWCQLTPPMQACPEDAGQSGGRGKTSLLSFFRLSHGHESLHCPQTTQAG